jgi:hypothetical protein
VPSGYVHCSQKTIIRLLARQTRLPGATDNTRYGEGRASPRSFLMHHVANISTAIQAADAQTILNAASARNCSVSHMGSCKVCDVHRNFYEAHSLAIVARRGGPCEPTSVPGVKRPSGISSAASRSAGLHDTLDGARASSVRLLSFSSRACACRR